jgi:hypothetical protein
LLRRIRVAEDRRDGYPLPSERGADMEMRPAEEVNHPVHVETEPDFKLAGLLIRLLDPEVALC